MDTVHDVSDGGLLVAIVEMTFANSIGAELTEAGGAAIPFFFGEDQGRYILSVPAGEADNILSDAAKSGVPVSILGRTGGSDIVLAGKTRVALSDLRAAHENWFPAFMAANPG